MLEIASQVLEPTTMLAILSAMAVFATIVTLALPFIERDELATRP